MCRGPVKPQLLEAGPGYIETCEAPTIAGVSERAARVLVCGNPGPASRLLESVNELVHISLEPAQGIEQLRSLLKRLSPTLVVFTPATLACLLGADQGNGRSGESLAEETRVLLSPVNAELVRLVAKGLRNPEIERVTGMKVRTVRAHLSELYRRFEVTNRTELVGVLIERDYPADVAGVTEPSAANPEPS
jgi:DNA-binding CsgD family transcriptional regulator